MSRFIRAIREAAARQIKESGLLPSYRVRERLAERYLKGSGLEIGALHLPLQVPNGTNVRYVDLVSREENIRRHPDLPGDRIVHSDYIDDGFTLNTVEPCSQDFLIANHVLEHSPNPFQALINWGQVLKPGGVLLISVPLAEKCFDRGRNITTTEHLLEDFIHCYNGAFSAFAAANREHYREWLTISEPRIRQSKGEAYRTWTPEQLESEIDRLSSRTTEIHFHTFTKETFKQFLDYFIQTIDQADYELKELCSSRGNRECVAIIQKMPC